MGGMTRPSIPCVACGKTHLMSPAAMAIVIIGFQRGMMQTIHTNQQIRPRCLLAALTIPELIKSYRYRSIEATTVDTPVEV